MSASPARRAIPERRIDVVESGRRARNQHVALVLGRDVTFSTAALETYAFARWEPVIYDAMVLAAAVEYGDRIVKRPSQGWKRRISLRLPVHEPQRWNDPAVAEALRDAVALLTGDDWSFEFVKRATAAPSPSQDFLHLPMSTEAVVAYSDGMDSRAVAGILGISLRDRLVRVRVGSKSWDRRTGKREPFTLVPYGVPCNMNHRESSSRSRGFKFALIAAIAAYLTDAKQIVLPESGQGAIGPALLMVGHVYPDYRNHPLFTVRMERFVAALFGKDLRYVFPRLWNTKGETLRDYVSCVKDANWVSTRSCWQGSRWSSVNGKRRQCGICAACMLRRVAVHSAGLTEATDTYVCINMAAESLERGVDPAFTRLTRAYREYAIAGVLYMDQLAAMAGNDSLSDVKRHATVLAPALGLSRDETLERLAALLLRHAEEWKSYVASLGPRSFAARWIRR